MLFANQPTSAIVVLALIAGGVALFAVSAALALMLYRGYERCALRSLERAYAGLGIHTVAVRGDVVLVYHTYHGFLAWTTETAHRVVLPPDDARVLLGRLLRFNLSWGLAVHGGILVPPLAIGNYVAQRHSITRQETAATFAAALLPVAALDDPRQGRRPSWFRRFFGWLSAVFCGTFAVSSVVFLLTREIEAGLGGVLLAIMFGLVAHEWLRNREAGGGLNPE